MNQPVPDWCFPPELNDPRLWGYFEAFWELSTCRGMGFGALGPIPWTAIDRFAERHYGMDVGEVEYDDFEHAIRSMDEEFLRVHHGELEKQRQKSEADIKQQRARQGLKGRR